MDDALREKQFFISEPVYRMSLVMFDEIIQRFKQLLANFELRSFGVDLYSEMFDYLFRLHGQSVITNLQRI